MLGRKSKSNSTANNASSNGSISSMDKGSTTIIAKGTKIEGKISCTQNVRLDGIILGEITCDARLVMGDSGRIEGKIKTQDADIRGSIECEIHVTGLLHLQSTASVNGDITTGDLKVEQGAVYTGTCKAGKTNRSTKQNQGNAAPAATKASAGSR